MDAAPDFTQAQVDLQSLNGALQSGDLAKAQQAFAQWQKDDPRVARRLDAGTVTAGSGSSLTASA